MKKKFYLLPPGSPEVLKYKEMAEAMAQQEMHTLNLNVPTEVVESGDVAMLQELVAAMEHYPFAIEKLLFAVHLRFQEIKDSELYIHEDDWKSDPKYFRWFNKMNQVPFLFYFLHDKDARYYALAGDFIADGQVDVEIVPGEKDQLITFKGEALQAFFQRIYMGSLMMLHYCREAKINLQPYVEAILADYNTSFTYEEIEQHFKEDLEKGVIYRVTKEGEEKG